MKTTIMMMMEKTTIRKPVRRKGTLTPKTHVSESRKRSHHSLAATYRKDAMQLPEMEPMPPMTTMSRIS